MTISKIIYSVLSVFLRIMIIYNVSPTSPSSQVVERVFQIEIDAFVEASIMRMNSGGGELTS